MQNSRIALNFFPLSQQNFAFEIYRRPWNGEKKEDFPSCSRRKLPITSPNEYGDYWVSFVPKDGFIPFQCDSDANPYLTTEVIFEALLRNCQKNLDKDRFEVEGEFRRRIVFKILDVPEEGVQTVWLEAYYLKALRRTGFLADFKFYKSSSAKFSKRIQQLSLSLDKEGRSNINFYADRFEMLQRFISKYFDQISLLKIGDDLVSIEKKLLDLEADDLKPKKYIFASNKLEASQFMGVKNNGPYIAAPELAKIYFVYREQDKSYSQDMFRALRGDTFNSTFPGMEKMFKYPLNGKNVSGRAIKDFDTESLEEAIEAIKIDASERPFIPVLVTPFNKFDENEDANSKYFIAKHTFLRYHIPSQFVSLRIAASKEQLKWAVSNIGLQIFAKMGGMPWIVSPQTNNCLIVGLGQAHKVKNGITEKYFAYSVLTDSTGLYKDLRVLSLTEDLADYSLSFRKNLESIFKQYIDLYDSFVVHVTFSIRKEEIEIIQSVLDGLSSAYGQKNKRFIVMRFNDDNKFFGYSRENNSKVPFESSFIQLSHTEFLVWFEGLQYHNPTIRKRLERPLYIEFVYPKELPLLEMKNYLQDALNLSGANWRGFNAKSLPISIYYAKLVADYYKEFQSLDLGDIDVEKITPWFL